MTDNSILSKINFDTFYTIMCQSLMGNAHLISEPSEKHNLLEQKLIFLMTGQEYWYR